MFGSVTKRIAKAAASTNNTPPATRPKGRRGLTGNLASGATSPSLTPGRWRRRSTTS